MKTLVLRNYNCQKSAEVAKLISGELFTERYDYTHVDHNDTTSFPPGKDKDGVELWYKEIKKQVAEADFIIPILSSELEKIKPDTTGGIGLLSELLYLWHKHKSGPEIKSRIIPIVVDDRMEDIRSAPGSVEQIQDIVVPMLRDCSPIEVHLGRIRRDAAVKREFIDAVASRLGVSK